MHYHEKMKSAAIGIILNKTRDEVLLIERADIPVWVLPGGGIEPLECEEKAAIREVYEETGLMTELVRKTGEYTPINRLSSLTHVFECRILDGQLQKGPETKNIAFFPIDKLPKSFFILHRYFLEEALKSDQTVKRALTEVTYFNVFKFFFRHPIILLRALLARLTNR